MTYGYRHYFRLLRRTLFPGAADAPIPLQRRLIIGAILPLLMALQAVHRFAFLIDDLLFSGYKQIRVREPLFIVGVPRSGTTYLHRLLAQDDERFVVFRFWELLLAPAICQRKLFLGAMRIDRILGGPVKRVLTAAERLLFHGLDDIHRSSLAAPEEDYFAFLPICACFLLIALFPEDEALWRLSRFDEAVPEGERERIMAFHYACFQRHLYIHGEDRRILSKNPSFSSLIRALDRTYPDSRIICCLRNPLQAVPSLVSSMTTAADILHNGAGEPAFQKRLTEMALFYYRHLTGHLPRMPEDRHAFLTMEALKADSDGQVRGVYRRLGYSLSPAFASALRRESRQARHHVSRHRYSLEQFGIPPERLTTELGALFEAFSFQKPPADD